MSLPQEQQDHRPACAVCKHQRRRCQADCVFAAHFPVNKTEDFKAALEVFGVKNLQKILMSLGSDADRATAVESVVWEASVWKKDPVNGPFGGYKRVIDELRVARDQIALQQRVFPYMTDSGLIELGNANKENQGAESFMELLGGRGVPKLEPQVLNCNNVNNAVPHPEVGTFFNRFANPRSVINHTVNYNMDFNQTQVVVGGQESARTPVNYQAVRTHEAGPTDEPIYGPRPNKRLFSSIGDQALPGNYAGLLEPQKRFRQEQGKENGPYNFVPYNTGLPPSNSEGQGYWAQQKMKSRTRPLFLQCARHFA